MIIPFPTIPNPEGLANYWQAKLEEKNRIKDAYESFDDVFDDEEDEEEYGDCGHCRTCRFIDFSFS